MQQREVPEDGRNIIIVSLYKGKCRSDDCNIYWKINILSVPGKVYGRVSNESILNTIESSVSDGFKTGRGCVDRILPLKIMVEK